MSKKFDSVYIEAKGKDEENEEVVAPEEGEEGKEETIKLADVKAFLKDASEKDLKSCAKEIEKLLDNGDDEDEGDDEGEEEEGIKEDAFTKVLKQYGLSSKTL